MYYLVSPFSKKNNGISNYCVYAKRILESHDIECKIIENPDSLNVFEFEKKIRSIVKPNDVLELPDAWGLFSSSEFPCEVHVRLHAPSLYLQKINNGIINEPRYLRELKTVNKANMVSSPSYSNYKCYENKLSNISIYPNPIIYSDGTKIQKSIDYIYIGRFEKVKGADYLASVLYHLPEGAKVSILGIEKNKSHLFHECSRHLDITFHGWVDNRKTYNLLSKAKVCLMLSRFESFSYVVAESINAQTKVVSWDVGGIAECFPDAFVKVVKQGDVLSLTACAIELNNNYKEFSQQAKIFIKENNDRFVNGVKQVISGKTFIAEKIINRAHSPNNYHIIQVQKEVVSRYFSTHKPKIFGYSMMNEHAEQMWACLHRLIKDYRYISRKPLGYNQKFEKNFHIDSQKFKVYDWRFNLDRLKSDIVEFDPDFILVFNGNTEHFKKATSFLIEHGISKPTVYTELGWLPQKNKIYLDSEGANSFSKLAKSSLSSLTGHIEENIVKKPSIHNKVLLALQLPGDTTLEKPSNPRNFSHMELIHYVRDKIPKNQTLIIRKHPRDINDYNISEYRNTYVDNNINIEDTFCNVDAVITVNSTIALEAMKYDINIYTFGFGIFSNKNLTIDCSHSCLESSWISNIYFDREKRSRFLKYLSERQIDVQEFEKSSDIQSYGVSLYPIIDSFVDKLTTGINFENMKDIKKVESINKTVRPLKKDRIHIKNIAAKIISSRINKNKRLIRALLSVRAIRSFVYSDLLIKQIKAKKFDSEFDNAFSEIKKFQALLPEKSYTYYKTKWVYEGISKDGVRFAKSNAVNKLDIMQRFDMASLLAESGNYQSALNIAIICLSKEPAIFRKKQYLRLASLVSKETVILENMSHDESSYIKELAACFERVSNDQIKARDYFNVNKHSFTIIGNSPNQRGIKKGKEINTKRSVIRFNSYNTSLIRRSDVGMKTDVWVKSPSFEDVVRKDIDGLKMVLVTGTNHLDRSPQAYDFFYDFLQHSNLIIAITPPAVYKELFTKIKSPPSGGIQMLFTLKELYGKLDSNDIHGFSLVKSEALKGPNGERNAKIAYSHNWDKEIEIIQSEIVRK